MAAATRLTIAGGHALRIEEGASATWGPTNTDIDIQAPSSLVNAGTLVISNDTQVFGSGTFVNSGTLVKDSHLQTTLVAPFDNDGTVELRAGTLELQTDGGLGSTGAITLAATTHLRTGTGAITLGPAASVSGPGTLDVISGSLIVPATATWDVAATNISGTLTLDGERTIALPLPVRRRPRGQRHAHHHRLPRPLRRHPHGQCHDLGRIGRQPGHRTRWRPRPG